MKIIRRVGRFFSELYNGKPMSHEGLQNLDAADRANRRDMDGYKYSQTIGGSGSNGLNGF
jgi:hypothetical protein